MNTRKTTFGEWFLLSLCFICLLLMLLYMDEWNGTVTNFWGLFSMSLSGSYF